MTKRSRRAAWASITEVERGAVYRIRYWSAGPDGYRRRSCTIRGTRKQAEQRRAELMLAHSDDAPCPTMGEVWERWYLPATVRRVDDGDLSEHTLMQTRSTWNRHVSPRWESVPCDAVRPLHIQQWLDGMTRGGATRGLGLLRTMLDYPVRYGLIETNPARERYLMPSKSTVAHHDDGVWTLAELGEAWRAVHGQWFEAAFLLAAFGGLRLGESMGVRGEDVRVDVIAGVPVALVSVERQVQNRGEVTERLKTAQSRRVVAIPGRAATRLGELAASERVWLSGDGMGGPNTQARLNASWSAAGMAHPFRNLRNSWQTWMRWELRVPPYYIEVLMGHAGKDVTSRYYDRPQAEMFAEVMADAYRANPYDAGWTWLD